MSKVKLLLHSRKLFVISFEFVHEFLSVNPFILESFTKFFLVFFIDHFDSGYALLIIIGKHQFLQRVHELSSCHQCVHRGDIVGCGGGFRAELRLIGGLRLDNLRISLQLNCGSQNNVSIWVDHEIDVLSWLWWALLLLRLELIILLLSLSHLV